MPERDEEEMDEEEESDSRGRRRSTSTNGFADPYPTSPQPSLSSYHWQDRSETLSGSGKGWLRISDDSVHECGIENVLAEGSGVFMLYYERAVWGAGWMNPKEEREKTAMIALGHRIKGKGDFDADDADDVDGDRFSIGSEETLRPKIRVIDLNGSVGSLVSEVGVGIMKQKKDDKAGHGLRMKDDARGGESSMNLSVNSKLYSSSVSSVSSSLSSTASSSKIFGPRIVRSVNARRDHSVGMNGSAIPAPEMANGVGSLNGSTQHGARDDTTEDAPWDMTTSAPSILQVNNSVVVKPFNQTGLGSKW
jgi:ubiquitin carboxyl-terminal hydrolase 1